MLADSKLPITFWAEAVNTACYVQNRVLVIKPHNKTPYELFLGKFNRKADEGFFVVYSTNSKAFRVFNGRTRTVEENLHVKFHKNTPNIAGSEPNWLFDIDALTKSMNYKPVVAGNQSNSSAGTKACDNIEDSPGAGFKPSGEEEKKDDENLRKEDSVVPSIQEPKVNQKKDANVNSTKNINTVSPTDNAAGIEDNVVDENIVYGCADDLNMPDLEEIGRFSYVENDDLGADMNSLDTNFQVSHVPTTRIHKDQPLEQVIRDLHSAHQTSKMSKNLEGHGLVSTTRIHKDQPLEQVIRDLHSAHQTRLYGVPDGCEECLFMEILKKRKEMCTELEKMTHKKFQMSSMGELTFLLGIQTASTPMETHKTLLKDEKGEDVDEHLYRSRIGSLMYLTSSRPDIMFAGTAKVKNINGETQLHAKVDENKVVISEASIRRDLWFVDEGGIDCLPNKAIFKQLSLIGAKATAWNDFSSTIASAVICLATNQKFNFLSISLIVWVLNLETTKIAQAKEIANLKKRVKRLEREGKLKTYGLKRLYKVRLSARVESSTDKESLNEDIFGVNDQDDTLMFDDDKDLQGKEVVVKKAVADKEDSVVEEVNHANITTPGSAAATTTTTATTPTIFIDEITLARALIEIKTSRPKEKGLVMQEPRIMVEEPLNMQKKDQILFDEEVARKLQEDIYKQEILIIERDRQEKEANSALIETWEDIQAMLDADYQLAERLHAEEQEKFTNAKKAKLFMEFMEKRRKIFDAKRDEERRKKPPFKAQQRSIMSTYLKNMDRWKPRALKNKSFAEIKELFYKVMERINSFVDFITELVEESTKKDDAVTVEESSSKRAGDDLVQVRSKKQTIEDENESVELRRCLEIVPDDEDEVTIDATPLSSKSPTIVDYKNFDREDLEVLWRLVKDIFVKTKPVDDMDSFLMHTLKTMFKHHVEDNAQQKALNDTLVASADRLKFGNCNIRLKTDIKPKEATFQVAKVSVHRSSIKFMINKKKVSLDVEIFKEILQQPVQATKGTRIKTKAKVAKTDKKKQPAMMPKSKGLAVLFEVPDELQQKTSESWGVIDEKDDDKGNFEEEVDINDDDSDDNDETDNEGRNLTMITLSFPSLRSHEKQEGKMR
nr:hypothetical protein [Tanacetum cinerariifolium]